MVGVLFFAVLKLNEFSAVRTRLIHFTIRICLGKLTFAAHASTRNTYQLTRFSYIHAILGETVELVSS